MSIKATKLKKDILRSSKKHGILIEPDSEADRLLTRATTMAAGLFNDGEKRAKKVVREMDQVVEKARASVHEATAPRKRQP